MFRTTFLALALSFSATTVFAAAHSVISPTAETEAENTPVTFNGFASNVDSPSSEFIALHEWLLDGVTQGQQGGAPTTFTFTTPSVGPAGQNVTVTLRVFGSQGDSSDSSAALFVSNNNISPTANAGPNFSVQEGATAILNGSGSDPDGYPAGHTYLWTRETSGPPNIPINNATSEDASFVAPAVGPGGAQEIFSFRITDPSGGTDIDQVTVTILNNDPPTAFPQGPLAATEDTPLAITLQASDPESGPLTYSASQPQNGVLNGTGPNRQYVPNANFNGPDAFTFSVTDNANQVSAAVTVSIVVNPVNDAPTATPQNVSTNEDVPLPIVLTGADVDGNPLTYAIVTQPTRGVLSGTPPNVVYTPNANTNGVDTFTFRAVDNSGAPSAPATVTITVNGTNDPPVATPQSVTTPEDTARAITLTGIDPEGNALTFAVATPPVVGTLTGTPPTLTYTPPLNFNGVVTFTFTATDNGAPAATSNPPGTVTITVTPVDDAPVANAGPNKVIIEAGQIQFEGSATDVDGADPITYQWIPSTGLNAANIPNPTYSAPVDLPAEQVFVYTLRASGSGGVTTSSMTVRVTNGLPPVANAGLTGNATEGSTVTLQGSGPDPDNQLPVTFLWTQIAGTSVTIINPTDAVATFVAPQVNSQTSLTFRLTVRDGGGNTGVADVTWVIYDVAQALPINPMLSNLAVYPSPFNASEGATIRFDLFFPADVKILIVDVFGKIVREFGTASGGIGGVAGTNLVRWDGKNGEGNAIGNGAYIVQVRAEGAGQKGKMTERVGVKN